MCNIEGFSCQFLNSSKKPSFYWFYSLEEERMLWDREKISVKTPRRLCNLWIALKNQLRITRIINYILTVCVADPGCLSWILDPDFIHPGSRNQQKQQQRMEIKLVVLLFL
jgi:hypothetical protein